MLLANYFEDPIANNLTDWSLKACSDLSDKDLDLLMLCRKSTDNDIIEKMINNASFPDSDSLFYIKGKVVNNKNVPVTSKVVTLFTNNGPDAFYTDTTDANGRFVFPLTEYVDSTKFTIQVSTIKGEVQDDKVLLEPHSVPRLICGSKLKKQFNIQNKTIDRVLQFYSDTINYNKPGYLKPVTVKTYLKEDNYDKKKKVERVFKNYNF
ncbi:MAG: carboxypeptidase-like regulatory domain-containing protein [Segetibacter sp.]